MPGAPKQTIWAKTALIAALLTSAAPTLAGASAVAAVEPPKPLSVTEQGVVPDLADPATEILSLEEDRNRRLTVPVMIDGSGPYDFMIDTGSQATAVTHEINESLSLAPLGTATLIGMASARPVNLVEVETLTVGRHEIYDLTAPVLSRNHVGADGILGLDMLQDFRVLIDFREETIAVEDVSERKNLRRGFEIVVRARKSGDQLLITNALVEGVRAVVIIDTGAQSSIANLALKERIRAKREQEIITTDVNGVSFTGRLSFVRDLDIHGLQLKNIGLTFTDAPAFAALGLQDKPVLSLGMHHLKMFDRVAIDFSNNRILFDVPRKIARQLRKNRMRWNR